MPDLFAIYIAQKPYQDELLGQGWRTHRFLMLADEAQGVFRANNGSYYMPEQELHYVWEKGSEYDMRGAWNRALATGVALNKENLHFADFKNVSEIEALNTCDAGVQAGLDAMGIIHDFGRAGMFNADLFVRVAALVPDLDPAESLEDRRAASIALMRQVQATRKIAA